MGLLKDGLQPSDLFAVVIYVPDPLRQFLDDLRRALVPDCVPRAHVTVLPPRPLAIAPQAAIEQARRIASGFAPFDLELGRIEIFRETDVVYIELSRGAQELQEMYRALNVGALRQQEPFPYHPHITLAQGLDPGQARPLLDVARRRLAEFPHNHPFRAEQVIFVESRDCIRWRDLAVFSLEGVPAR